MWVEACSLVVFFQTMYQTIRIYHSLCIYQIVSITKMICASFFQWQVRGSRVEKTWHVLGPDCKLRLPFQIRLAYDMGSNDILETKYEQWTVHNNWRQHIGTFASILKHKIFENIWLDEEFETKMSLIFQTGWLLHILKTRTWSLFPATMQ